MNIYLVDSTPNHHYRTVALVCVAENEDGARQCWPDRDENLLEITLIGSACENYTKREVIFIARKRTIGEDEMKKKEIDNAFDFMHEIVKGRIKQEKRNIKNAVGRDSFCHEYALKILQGLHRDFIHCRESWVERNPKH